jgi:hypothetical protein
VNDFYSAFCEVRFQLAKSFEKRFKKDARPSKFIGNSSGIHPEFIGLCSSDGTFAHICAAKEGQGD